MIEWILRTDIATLNGHLIGEFWMIKTSEACNVAKCFQVDGQKGQNRGSTRYHSSPTIESSIDSSISTTRSPRVKSSRSGTVSELTKHETHPARETSIKTRLKTPDDYAVPSRANVDRHANPAIDNVRNRSNSQAAKKETTRSRHNDNKETVPESQAPKRQTASRRISSETSTVWVDDAKLDLEVFTKSPDHSRSRTGRKIHIGTNERESKVQTTPLSRKSSNENAKKIESPRNGSEKEEARVEHSQTTENILSKVNVSGKTDTKITNASGDHKDEVKERDVLLSGSESIRVDVPLTVGNDEDANSNILASTSVSRQISGPVKEKVESNDIAKKSRQSDRSKSRVKSNTNLDSNLDVINLASVSRRGTSKFGGTATAETSERSSSSRHRSNSKGTRTKSRSRSTHKSKDIVTEAKGSGRSRTIDIDLERNGRAEKRRTSSNDRRTSEGKRRSNDTRSKVAETRGRSRSVNGFGKFDLKTEVIIKANHMKIHTILK